MIPSRISVSVSSIPSRSEAAASGQVRSSSEASSSSRCSSEVVFGQRPRAADPDEDLRPVALGQQIGDVALLVAVAAVHERVLAEHVLDRLAQRLDAVNAVANRRAGRRWELVLSGGR